MDSFLKHLHIKREQTQASIPLKDSTVPKESQMPMGCFAGGGKGEGEGGRGEGGRGRGEGGRGRGEGEKGEGGV